MERLWNQYFGKYEKIEDDRKKEKQRIEDEKLSTMMKKHGY